MKKYTLLSLLLFGATLLSTAQITAPPNGGNQKSVVTQYIGALAHVTITYNSPDVTGPNGEDRTGKIWGQLVPYGFVQQGFGLNNPSPWRAGANECTTIEFSHDMTIQGKPVKAGKYGFFVAVAESGPWTVVLSENADMWGSYFYDEKEDVLRVEATPQENEFHEWLTYEFTDRQPGQATFALMWEKIKLPVTVAVPNENDLYLAKIRQELQNSTGFNYNAYVQAVNFCVQNNMNLEEAAAWADYAISGPFVGQQNYTTLQAKASVLAAMNKQDEAMALMDEAIKEPTASAGQIHNFCRQLIATGQKEKALEVAEYNYERYDGVWPTHVTMTRALSANGQYDEALEHAEKALAQAPDQLNRQNLEQVVEKLKNKEDIN